MYLTPVWAHSKTSRPRKLVPLLEIRIDNVTRVQVALQITEQHQPRNNHSLHAKIKTTIQYNRKEDTALKHVNTYLYSIILMTITFPQSQTRKIHKINIWLKYLQEKT